MSKPVNPTAIGAFLLGGLALLTVALLLFGGGQFFQPRLYWVVFFDSSLNGLNVGAPVKVQGVQVGTVKEIVLQIDLKQDRLLKPVVLEITPGLLVNPDGEPIRPVGGQDEAQARLQQLIDSGLRARLETQSILTGLLFVDLGFYPDREPHLTGLKFRDYPEVPAIPPTVEEVKRSLEQIITRIQAMPLEQIAGDISATMTAIHKIVSSDETRQTRESLARSLAEAQKLLAELNRQLPPLMREVGQAVRTANTTVATADQTATKIGQAAKDVGQAAQVAGGVVKDLGTGVKPVLAAAEQSLQKATLVLQEAKDAAANVADTTAADSELQASIVELREAARSVRLLSDMLERQPNSLIFGKSN
jgi:paraquat-inducible protein B